MSTSIADVFVQIGVHGVSAVSTALDSVSGYLNRLGTAASAALGRLAGTGGIVGGMAQTFQGIIGIGGGLMSILSGVGQAMRALTPIAFAVGNAFYNSLNVALGGLPERIAQVGAQVASAVLTAFQSLGPIISRVIQAIAPHFSRLAPLINAAFAKGAQIAGIAARIGSQLVSGIAAKLNGLRAAMSGAWNSVKQGARAAGHATVKAFVDQFKTIDAALGGRLSYAGRQTRIIASVIRTNFSQAFNGIVAQMPQVLAAFGPIGAGMNQIMQGVITSANGVATALRTVAATAQSAGQAITTMYAQMIPVVGQIYAVVSSVSSSVFGFLRSAFSGFFNFVRSGISTLIGMVRSLASVLLTPLRILKNFIFSAQGMLAGLVGTLSAAAVGKYIVEVTSDAEQAAIAFDVMLGSAEKAKFMLQEIQALADKTPLQLPEVRQGARTLLAMNVAAREVVPTLRMLGDVSQGVQIPLNDLVQIYGKINQKNRIMGDDLRQFGRRGIPVVRELAKEFNTTTDAIYEMASKGELHFSDLEKAFKDLTGRGGEFHDLMARMSDTITGRWSTLQDSFRAVAIQIGEAIAPAIKKAIDYFIEFAEWGKKAIEPYKKEIARFAEYAASRIPPLISTLKTALPAMMEVAKTTFAVIKAIHGITDALIKGIVEMVGGTDKIAGGFTRIVKEIRFVAEEWRLVMQLVGAYISNFLSISKQSLSTLWDGVAANAKHLFLDVIPTIAGMSVLIIQGILDNAIKRFVEGLPVWLGGNGKASTGLVDGLEATIQQFKSMAVGSLSKFPGFKPFDFEAMFGLNDPKVKEILELLLGKRKLFWFKEAMEPLLGWFDEVKKFFGQNKVDLGGPQGEHGVAEARDKGKIGIEGLTEYYKNIQQSASPMEAKRDRLAQDSNQQLRTIAQHTSKLNNLGARGATFGT